MAVEITDLKKKFEQQTVLEGFSAKFGDNSITCIMGASGAGKTTLLNILLGLMDSDGGTVSGINGKRLSAVFQEDRLCEGLDAIGNIKLVADKKITRKDIEEEFSRVGLEDYRGKPVSELSGGMKRRIALVRALITDPDIVIMDEPLKGLDAKLKHKATEYIKEKVKNKITIIVTHDKAEAEAFGAEIIMLKKKSSRADESAC